MTGPNGSGKTTILEAISRADNREFGHVFSDDEVESLRHLLGSFTAKSGYLSRNDRTEIPKRTFPSGYRCTDVPALQQSLYDLAREFRLTDFDPLGIVQYVQKAIGEPPDVHYVPAKRRLQESHRLNSSELVSTNGDGVLNRSFFASILPDDDPEKIRFQRFRREFTEVTAGRNFQYDVGSDNLLTLSFVEVDGTRVPIGEAALGLAEVFLLLYFAHGREPGLLLIEELENHCHPLMQRRLVASLSSSDSQIILSTHSNVVLSEISGAGTVYSCSNVEEVQAIEETALARALGELGYSIAENIARRVVLLVEGPNDVKVYNELLRQLDKHSDSLVHCIPVGGDNMAKLPLDFFREHHAVFGLFDADKGSMKARNKAMSDIKNVGGKCHLLTRGCVEQYFSEEVAKRLIPSLRDRNLRDGAEKYTKEATSAMKSSGGAIVREMGIEAFEETDLLTFLSEVLDAARNIQPHGDPGK